MTHLYFGGGEDANHLGLLCECGVERIAVNVSSFFRRQRARAAWTWPVGKKVLLYADNRTTDIEDVLGWVEQHGTPEWLVGPENWVEHVVADTFLPLWVDRKPETGVGFVIPDHMFKDAPTRRRVLMQREGIVGVITGSVKDLNRFDLVVTGSWWETYRNGETHVWDGRAMHRYNANHKIAARERHAEAIEALNIDLTAVMNDDPRETATLAILSWLAFERSMGGLTVVDGLGVSTTRPDQPEPERVASVMSLDTRPGQRRHGHRVPLPVMGLRRDPEDEAKVTLTSPEHSLRRCDTCFLAAVCPGFEAHAACAYSIPVTIRTKDELQGALSSVLEMQTQRVFLARFAEELAGQELDPAVGNELDRLFNLTWRFKEIMDARDTLSISLEAKGGGGGILSRLFGADVGQRARALSAPVRSDDVLGEVIDPDE